MLESLLKKPDTDEKSEGVAAGAGGETEDRAGLDRIRREAKTFFRFLRFLSPHKVKVTLLLLMVLIGVPLGQFGAFVGRTMIDDVILALDKPLGDRFALFGILLAIQFTLWFVSHGFKVVNQILGFYLNFAVSLKLKKVFYNHLHLLSLGFLQSRPVGEHMYRTDADTSGAGRQGVLYMITQDIPEAFALIYKVFWAALLIVMIDPIIAVAVIVYICPYTLLVHWLYDMLKGVMRRHKIESQKLAAVLRDGLNAMETVKSYGRITRQSRTYVKQILDERRAWWQLQLLSCLTNMVLLYFVHTLFHRGLYIYSLYCVMVGRLSIGEYMVVYKLARGLEEPLEQFIKLLQGIRLQLVPAERLLETLDVDPQIVDAPDAQALPPIQGRVDLRDVHFSYVPDKPVLRGLTVSIEPGESVAFVGPSGAGKSTIMYLLYRIYEAQSGDVLIDGHEVKQMKVDSIRNQLGVVLQSTHLFGGTFADNIRYGELRADDEKVYEAGRMADIDEFILSHPDGYDRDLGEGTKLSGGQRQRLGIARALIRDPGILVLDEATASLDPRTESNIMETVDKIMKGRTTLMISHRLVTVCGCDRIVVINEGRVEDQGTHRELLQRCDLYRTMWYEQTHQDLEEKPEGDA